MTIISPHYKSRQAKSKKVMLSSILTKLVLFCVLLFLFNTIIITRLDDDNKRNNSNNINNINIAQSPSSSLSSSSSSLGGTNTNTNKNKNTNTIDTDSYKVDLKCKNLPTIKPSGVFFLDNKIKNVLSAEQISPPFRIGSFFGNEVKKHMGADDVHFKLIKEKLKKKYIKGNTHDGGGGGGGGLTFDFGANQGFFTWYLAALGMNVHSFEISERNFNCLQHGQIFNNKLLANRVNLYPLGLNNKISRFDISGSNYGGFINEKNDEKDDKLVGGLGGGSILSVSFDCFAYHTKLDLSYVDFIKLDVEGFEIAVIMGASNSLFSTSARGKNKIGSMLMEVGPARWNRAHIDFQTGLDEMKKLSKYHFKNSFILIRTSGDHVESCPVGLVKSDEGGDGNGSSLILSDTNPKNFDNRVAMYKVKDDEWLPLLTKMEKHDYDCNFWYTNNE
jgi:FkbM family methyltransferase